MVSPLAVGVALSLVGNILINLGTNLTKLSYDRRRRRHRNHVPKENLRRLLGSKLWVSGMSLFIVGNILNFLSFGFAPQTLLAGLSAIQFVCNICFARILSKEPVSSAVIMGTIAIIAGNTIVVLLSPNSSSETLSLSDIWDLLGNLGFILYVIFVILLAIGIQTYFFTLAKRLRLYAAANVPKNVASGAPNPPSSPAKIASLKLPEGARSPNMPEYPAKYRAPLDRGDARSPSLEHSEEDVMVKKDEVDTKMTSPPEEEAVQQLKRTASSSLAFTALVGSASTLGDAELSRQLAKAHADNGVSISTREIKILPVIYAAQSAMLGSFSVVLAKALSSLLRTSFAGSVQLRYFGFYVILFLWVIAMLFWLTRMNKALKMFDGYVIIPVLQVFWIIFSILAGGLYYQEFQEFSVGSGFGFGAGVLVILVGVVMLARKKRKVQRKSFGHDHGEALAEARGREDSKPELSIVQSVNLVVNLTLEENGSSDSLADVNDLERPAVPKNEERDVLIEPETSKFKQMRS
jgi:hypothetical protein